MKPDADLVELTSPRSFEATVQALAGAIADAGLQVFATIDHAAAARAAGLSMPPTIVVLYGNPKGGTPVMLAFADAALDLPLRVLVRERADATTAVVFHAIGPLLARLGVPDDVASRLAPAQHVLVAALGG